MSLPVPLRDFKLPRGQRPHPEPALCSFTHSKPYLLAFSHPDAEHTNVLVVTATNLKFTVPAQTQGVLNASNRQRAWWESQVSISISMASRVSRRTWETHWVGYTLLGRHSMLPQFFLKLQVIGTGDIKFQITGPRITEVLREASLSRPP